MSRHVSDVPDEQRYELTDDGELLGVISYVVIDEGPPEIRDLQHTVVEPAHRGEGVAAEMVAAVFDLVRRTGVRIVPTCPYLATWMQEHPEDRDLVAER